LAISSLLRRNKELLYARLFRKVPANDACAELLNTYPSTFVPTHKNYRFYYWAVRRDDKLCYRVSMRSRFGEKVYRTGQIVEGNVIAIVERADGNAGYWHMGASFIS
jgi:hypothetical protein